ncbi:actin-related protein 6-like [Bradysia coprophila]|uniref:actin-related protein 6-like n=1 Tax=Bradysia coprophila TaxID=38358 RepID=UPI00187D9D4C|nr:actin-related protein 6-like [Bradysia coprophila]XP_037049083.1 actin-related protein 6-like [Bradysia coprophila]
MVNNIVTILDNGAYAAKIGSTTLKEPKIIPNCIMKAKSERRRPFIGDQIDDCRDISGLFYILCFQKGYLVNWDVQKTVWDYIFGQDCCAIDFTNPFIITEPQFNFSSIQEAITEIFFEEYECESLLRTTAADLCSYNFENSTDKKLCSLVIDMGFSFTHIIPFIKGKKVKEGIRRIDIGGKLLTNHLKEIISYRQLNVMDESYVINQVKEDACFVSQDFNSDMRVARKKFPENTIVQDYVLPDFTSIRRGFLCDPVPSRENRDQQTLRLTNERFAIPELLFYPSDIGIYQCGVPEAVMESLKACPAEATPHLLANIVVVGGCALFDGMESRLQSEIRALAPADMAVNVTVPKNAQTYAWEGGVKLSQNTEFLGMCMSREEYDEEGVRGAYDRFDI